MFLPLKRQTIFNNFFKTTSNMKEIIENLAKLYESFKIDADKAALGNKAAGVRARRASLEMEKNLKAFRKVSVK